MKTKVKVVVQKKAKNVPGWPCINYDYDKELARIMQMIEAENPDMDFIIYPYTSLENAKKDYEEDVKLYDGILVLLMTNWLKIDRFYIEQSKEGLPTIIADVPFCGSGSMLSQASSIIREGQYPVPMVASLDYHDIANAVKLFDVMTKIKNSKILVVKKSIQKEEEEAATAIWGCKFINKTPEELMALYDAVPEEKANALADKWIKEATGILEPTTEDVIQSAKIYYAIQQMKKETDAAAVTIDCLELSYNDIYGNNRHMYPCLTYYQMGNDGEIGVCEADINSTVCCMITRYMTEKPGYVSDPVIDTSSNQIIYSHCVACRKVLGKDNPHICQHYIRSHAEDKRGASVQVIFPCGEKLTTIQVSNIEKWASIHSAKSCGNVYCDNGCRSKLAATCQSENILKNWMPQWHRVTVFGDYRTQCKNLFLLKGYRLVEEDL